MKTTVDIDDDVLRQAEGRAALEDLTLGELINEALRAYLSRAAEPYVPVTYGKGGARRGVDITNNQAVRDAMDQP